MKNWMNELYYIIIFSTSTGTIAYGIWYALARCMEAKNKLRYIYWMLVSVMAFYLLPCFYLCTRLIYTVHKQDLVVGRMFLWTPHIMLIRCGLAVIWIGGMAVSIGKQLRKLRKMHIWFVNCSFPAEDEIVAQKDRIAKELHLKMKIEVYRNMVVSSPMVTGVLKKQVLLPEKNYEQTDLDAILYHELVHIRQRVVNIKFFIILLQVVQWFNPLIKDFLRSMDNWGETACDLAVQFDTKCPLSLKEYFGVMLKDMENEQAEMPDSETQFVKEKGVNDRMNILKNYKREKDFKLAGGALAIMMFIALSTSTVMASEAGIEYIHNSIYNITDVENKMQLLEGDTINGEEYVVYEESATEDEKYTIEIPILQRGGQFTFDTTTIPKNELAHSALFSVEEDGEIALSVYVDPSDVSVKAGIIKPNGSKLYIRGNDFISYRFTDLAKGDYRIYIDNDNDIEIKVRGSVVYK